MKNKELINKMEKLYPLMTSEFVKQINDGYELFLRKNNDYGSDNLKSGTTLSNEEEIKFALMGIWFRMFDKMSRLKNILFNNTEIVVSDESIQDTLTDLANYATICKIIKSDKWGK